jgi:hypothetical protein
MYIVSDISHNVAKSDMFWSKNIFFLNERTPNLHSLRETINLDEHE